jgi:Fe2+ or Zn2+ uptake regulation protein
MQPEYDTVYEAIADLQQRGFVHNFNTQQDALVCEDIDLRLHPDQFTVVEYHRFEGMTDPADAAVVYAIRSDKGIKGVLVNAYGIYADSLTAEMAHKLRHQR